MKIILELPDDLLERLIMHKGSSYARMDDIIVNLLNEAINKKLRDDAK